MLMATSPADLQAAIAVTRFGLGARPGEIGRAAADPKAWLLRQIRPEGVPPPDGPLPSSREALLAYAAFRQERQAMRSDGMEDAESEAVKAMRRDIRLEIADDFLARARLATVTDVGFAERWALFFANHFTVSATKQITGQLTAAYEVEAIRPHVFGRFEDLLLASCLHPAMLTYLDQAQSIGPNSMAGQRRKAGLNENLAREILELHTVGADAGYTQADVTELARALTGWSVDRQPGEARLQEAGWTPGGPRGARRAVQAQAGGEPSKGAVFRRFTHEPGPRVIMGRRYADSGAEQGLQALKDLAGDPRTARHVCRKIAAHFVSDEPPESLVRTLTTAWTSSGGRLDRVAAALVAAPEAWASEPRKLKTPYEFLVSCWRAVDAQPTDAQRFAPTLATLGQKAFSPPSPKGWPDEAAAWAAPDALVKRLSFARRFAASARPPAEPLALARQALGARLTSRTETAIARAESRTEALALLFMSPEFQRR
jgi:uncharacterized protein (DUF1800 family)